MTCPACGWFFHRDCEDCLAQMERDNEQQARYVAELLRKPTPERTASPQPEPRPDEG